MIIEFNDKRRGERPATGDMARPEVYPPEEFIGLAGRGEDPQFKPGEQTDQSAIPRRLDSAAIMEIARRIAAETEEKRGLAVHVEHVVRREGQWGILMSDRRGFFVLYFNADRYQTAEDAAGEIRLQLNINRPPQRLRM